MTTLADPFGAAAGSARHLLAADAVRAAWAEPSALAEFRVSGLAGHLAYQVLTVPRALEAPPATEPVIALAEHYERATWRGAAPDTEVNAGIRANSDRLAADGLDALLADVDTAIAHLRTALPASPGDRPVRMPAGPWSLTLDDFLVTRIMEIAVHSDDLAVSVGIATPELPDAVLAPVLALLTGLAVRQHGQPAVLRALTRAERAPAAINAL